MHTDTSSEPVKVSTLELFFDLIFVFTAGLVFLKVFDQKVARASINP